LFGRVSVLYHWRSEAALAHARLSNVQEAVRLAREEVGLAREFGRPGALGIALRNYGLVKGGDGGLALLAEAVRTLKGAQSRSSWPVRRPSTVRRCAGPASASRPEPSSKKALIARITSAPGESPTGLAPSSSP
jgi:hypothetical protein